MEGGWGQAQLPGFYHVKKGGHGSLLPYCPGESSLNPPSSVGSSLCLVSLSIQPGSLSPQGELYFQSFSGGESGNFIGAAVAGMGGRGRPGGGKTNPHPGEPLRSRRPGTAGPPTWGSRCPHANSPPARMSLVISYPPACRRPWAFWLPSRAGLRWGELAGSSLPTPQFNFSSLVC